MQEKTFHYGCTECSHTVETNRFVEARECPNGSGMLVNTDL